MLSALLGLHPVVNSNTLLIAAGLGLIGGLFFALSQVMWLSRASLGGDSIWTNSAFWNPDEVYEATLSVQICKGAFGAIGLKDLGDYEALFLGGALFGPLAGVLTLLFLAR